MRSNTRNLSDRELSKLIASQTNDELLEGVDSSGIRVGDHSIDELSRRVKSDDLISFVKNGTIKTSIGRQRVLAVLHQLGNSAAAARELEVDLLFDKSRAVLSNALFGLVFSRCTKHLPVIKEARGKFKNDKERVELFDDAIRALEENNPAIYSPNFWDRAEVWS